MARGWKTASRILATLSGVPPFSRSRNSLPVRKNGARFSPTETGSPVRGLRPMRDGRTLTEKAPKPRNSTRWPSASALVMLIQHRRHDALHIAVVEMRIARGQPRNQFRLDHPQPLRDITERVTPPGAC